MMMSQKEADNMESVCNLLDKLILQQLHLMEEKMICELNIETSINNGSIHLAKSRYIMGHNSISKEKLPTENTPEFSASVICESGKEDNVNQLKMIKTDGANINPLHWFGVLVPQNLHKAKGVFQNAVNFIVECVNIQLQINENIRNIEALKHYKRNL